MMQRCSWRKWILSTQRGVMTQNPNWIHQMWHLNWGENATTFSSLTMKPRKDLDQCMRLSVCDTTLSACNCPHCIFSLCILLNPKWESVTQTSYTSLMSRASLWVQVVLSRCWWGGCRVLRLQPRSKLHPPERKEQQTDGGRWTEI